MAYRKGLELKTIKSPDILDPDGAGQQKYALIVASVASMIDQFNMPNIRLLTEMGYHVDIAANFINGSTCTDEKIHKLMKLLDSLSADCYQIDFDRKATDIKADLRAFIQLDRVISGKARPLNKNRHHEVGKGGGYALVHSHSPIGGAVGRIVAKRHGIRTIYTAHGFHFYDGAPKKNWVIFYPIERKLSWITDVLITINREDYKRAKREFHARKTVYVPGIGVDAAAFAATVINREGKRNSLGVRKDDILLLSVGELNENKNHKAVIKALGEIRKSDPDIFSRLNYCIAGKGGLHKELEKLAGELRVKLCLLGFRNDVPELLKAADLFILPSVREGLNVGLMEAMASGLPCIVSDIRGNRDLILDSKQKFRTVEDLRMAIIEFASCAFLRNKYGRKNQDRVKKFDLCQVMKRMLVVYKW